MTAVGDIVRTVLDHYPDTQAIYLFGSYGTENEWPDSDVDIALLLPPTAVYIRVTPMARTSSRCSCCHCIRSSARNGRTYWRIFGERVELTEHE